MLRTLFHYWNWHWKEPVNVEKMVTAAYATLSNDDWTFPYNHMWPYGSVRGGDAYKGGGSVGD